MLVSVRPRCALTLALAALLCAASVGPALADQPVSLREALTGKRARDGRADVHAPSVARYRSESGNQFVLDRSGDVALLRYERSDEVWALRPTPAPGGDIIYRNDIGQPVIRATRLGGLILFTPDRPAGAPAALLGEGAPSKPPKLGPTELFAVLARSSARASRAAQRTIAFVAPDMHSGAEYVVASASGVAADTLVRMGALREGQPYLARVKTVRFRLGKKMDVRFHDGIVDVTINPSEGIAGRPSSSRIAKAIVGQR
jgi:hypothetical protein